MDAFDADVLIDAATPGHTLGGRIVALLPDEPTAVAAHPTGIGSVLLLPELLSKPLRDEAAAELLALGAILSRLELRPVDGATTIAEIAVTYPLDLPGRHLDRPAGAGALE